MRNAPAAVEKVPDTHCQQLTWLEAPVINKSSQLKHMKHKNKCERIPLKIWFYRQVQMRIMDCRLQIKDMSRSG